MKLFSPQLYISEMAHERVRGTLGSCVQLMVVLGIMGVYLAGMSMVNYHVSLKKKKKSQNTIFGKNKSTPNTS